MHDPCVASGPSFVKRAVRGQPHPTQGLDDVVHQRARLGVLAILREADRAEFGYLRDALALSDGNLSRRLRTLEDAGYVDIHKGYEGRQPRAPASEDSRGNSPCSERSSPISTVGAAGDWLRGRSTVR